MLGFIKKKKKCVCQALEGSKVVEMVDEQMRAKEDPEQWPIPTLDIPRTDFTQLINCPEFVPRQNLSSSGMSRLRLQAQDGNDLAHQ